MRTGTRRQTGVVLSVIFLFLLSCASTPIKESELGNAEAYYNRGLAYGKKGKYDQAISDFTRALELNPGNARAYDRRGFAYGKKGQYDQAISDFTKALEINPNIC